MPSFEEAATTLAAALNRHSDALEKFVKASGGAGAAGTTAGSTKPADKPAAAAGNKNKISVEEIQKRFGAYMSVTDKEVRNERKQHVLNIAGKFGADRATNIDPKHFKEALELLTAYEGGEDPFADEGAGEDEDASPI